MINEIVEIGKIKRAYASAAPQFGITKRIIIILFEKEMLFNSIDDYNNAKPDYNVAVYFNPVIISMKGIQYFVKLA